jgi:hypothetical protein
MFPDPVWPVVILAMISFGDAILCIKPVRFVADCFEGMGWPRRYWPLMPPIKFAATAGLISMLAICVGTLLWSFVL